MAVASTRTPISGISTVPWYTCGVTNVAHNFICSDNIEIVTMHTPKDESARVMPAAF